MNALKNKLLKFRSAYLLTTAEILSVVGASKKSAAVFRKLLNNRERYYAVDSVEIARTQFNLAQELMTGSDADRAEAEAMLRGTIAVFSREYDPGSAAVGQVEFRIGKIREYEGDYASAEALYRSAQRKFAVRAVSWLLDHAEVCDRLVELIGDRDDDVSRREVYHFKRTARNVRFQFQMRVMRNSRYGRYYRY